MTRDERVLRVVGGGVVDGEGEWTMIGSRV